MRVGVIGQGYVGNAISIAASNVGIQVVGYDINQDLINRLRRESRKNYLATSTPSDLEPCEIIVITVPTPLTEDRNPDLTYIRSAVNVIIQNIKKPILIVNESTSYPGTLRNEISNVISKATGIQHLYASSPERVDPGNSSWGISNTPRLISGLSEEAIKKAKEFYAKFCENLVIVSTPEVAEMTKLFENTFRQVNIALVNELAQICNSLGVDVREVISGAKSKPFGFMAFHPGPGVGGHCIPIDPSYLSFIAEKNGGEAKLIKLANQINRSMPIYVLNRIKADHENNLVGRRVLIVGVSYKADVNDARESVADSLIQLFKSEKAQVKWHDEVVNEWKGENTSNLSDADIAVIVTRHTNLDSEKLTKFPYVFDCTGTLPQYVQL